jgi:hypothetical protein
MEVIESVNGYPVHGFDWLIVTDHHTAANAGRIV